MDWIQNLLFNDASVAHTVILYAFVIALGVALGKMKFFGISLGVTFVLFVGLIAGHFGFSAEKNILHFVQEFGLILFIYSIGLQVGPSFFSSFKKGGLTLNMLAVGIVILNIAVALTLYFIHQGEISMPMMVGILSGAVTAQIRRVHFRGSRNRSRICGRLSVGSNRNHRLHAGYPGDFQS